MTTRDDDRFQALRAALVEALTDRGVVHESRAMGGSTCLTPTAQMRDTLTIGVTDRLLASSTPAALACIDTVRLITDYDVSMFYALSESLAYVVSSAVADGYALFVREIEGICERLLKQEAVFQQNQQKGAQ